MKCKDCDTILDECLCIEATLNFEELTYEEDLVKKIAVVLSVGNEAQTVRLIEIYAAYRLQAVHELLDEWRARHLELLEFADKYQDNEHNHKKFIYKSLQQKQCIDQLQNCLS